MPSLSEQTKALEVLLAALTKRIEKDEDGTSTPDSDFEKVDKSEESKGTDKDKNDEDNKEKKEPEKQKCEVRSYEARYDIKGERELVALDANKAEKEDADSDDEKARYALCSYKWYTRQGELESSSVEIMSPQTILALQKVINEYPDEHFYCDTVTIDAPYKPIFHYRNELDAYAEKQEDEDTKLHVRLLLSFMEKENRRAISQYTSSVQNATQDPSIGYSNL
ncbi:hypothetical protein LTR66_014393 [Elasticomyces elasticus]|nr:hypothetical protein LTR66_014393 [Elasticomyces elasticus]